MFSFFDENTVVDACPATGGGASTTGAGSKLDYNLGTSGTGNIRGSGMSDTRLNGTGNYQTRQVSDDYRAQEFPDGASSTAATYYLRVLKS